ncbi:TPA: DUF4145 domain-containing protein [Campylobacter jejuni]|uniref:DUF4145 domain-containing protein n=1 Tax=Campylobacter TaxID=194 RepID=UPI00069C1D64|nr:DUF4145 domain-containing protein [Campylobacter jejuni]EAH8622890.1 DUF4145 domain-containing protein [Campylobacter jejuni]EAI8690298.1 DUF4145 domain-containing protein [Campylobacter jejuni]EAJ2249496.1 DUF4145 domain-containing protein [Campylobacter jejuni]EAK9935845.1 DUF4145 domain-containing protein [Campylobacter jejuni]ECO2641223.1 DUF4145 domain-containing protein [Campylobacter jejuni]
MNKYTKPCFKGAAFNCPHCGVYSRMEWDGFYNVYNNRIKQVEGYSFSESTCYHCERSVIWYLKDENPKIFFPREVAIPPEENMPENVKEIYEEASLVLGDSPRASCALLRLALQELMKYLKENIQIYNGLKNRNINEDIKEIINIGNFYQEQKESLEEAMNSIRLIGNKASHPSELDINDNSEIANILFEMINFIVGEIITKPKEREERLNKLKSAIGEKQ